MKIKFNQKLVSIFNFIETSEYKISFSDLIHWSIDMDCYKEFYLNLHIIQLLLDEHNSSISSLVDKKEGGIPS